MTFACLPNASGFTYFPPCLMGLTAAACPAPAGLTALQLATIMTTPFIIPQMKPTKMEASMSCMRPIQKICMKRGPFSTQAATMSPTPGSTQLIRPQTKRANGRI